MRRPAHPQEDPRQPIVLFPEVVDGFRTVLNGGLGVQDPFDLLSIELGMRTTARIRADLSPAGMDWISFLRTRHIRMPLQRPKPSPGQGPAVV